MSLRHFFFMLLLGRVVFGSDTESLTLKSAEIVISNFNGTGSIHHITPHLLEIARNGHQLPEEIKTQLKELGFNFSGKLVSRSISSRPESEGLNLIHENDVFRFHYTLNGDNAIDGSDSDNNGMPDYLETVVTAFETVYNQLIAVMDYYPPPSDDWYPSDKDNGDSGHFDIYLTRIQSGWYGLTQSEEYADNATGDNENSPVEEKNAVTSYMALRNNYDGFPNTEEESIKVTAAHEFYHAVQFGYDAWEQYWLMEATAVWMEEALFDEINDCYQYMPSWFGSPHTALDQNSSHYYGSFIYFEYIDQHLGGPASMRRIWDASVRNVSSDVNDFSHIAISEGLVPIGSSFPDALNKMVIANRIMSSSNYAGSYSYDEADAYLEFMSGPATYWTVYYTANDPQVITSTNLQRYASQYTKISTSTPVKVELTNTSGPDSDLKLHVIIETGIGSYIVKSNSPVNIDPTPGFNWIYAAVVSQDDNGSDWNYELVLTDGTLEIDDFSISIPDPNPFNTFYDSLTTFQLIVQKAQSIRLSIVNSNLTEVYLIADQYLQMNQYTFTWHGRLESGKRAPSGKYYISASSDDQEYFQPLTVISSADFSMSAPYPNPTGYRSRFMLSVAVEQDLTITILNVMLREVDKILEQRLPVGNYYLVWDGKIQSGEKAASGIYYILTEGDRERKIKKITVLR